MQKVTIESAFLLVLLFIVGCIFDVLPLGRTFLLRDIPSIYFLCTSVVLLWFFVQRIVDKQLRRSIIVVGAMIFLWFFIRIVKYVAFQESDVMVRYLWYAYYIPRLLIPAFSFRAALCIDRVHERRNMFLGRIAVVTAFCMIGLILTNDFHQIIFRFYNGFQNALDEYSYSGLYWICIGFEYLLLLLSILMIIQKCTLRESKKIAWIFIFYASFFIVLLILLQLNLRITIAGRHFSELAEIEGFLAGGLWVLSIQMGLVPSNRGYGKFMEHTGLAIEVTDKQFETIYCSEKAYPLSESEHACKEKLHLNPNVTSYRKPVSGGYVYWQVDYTEQNNLNEELANIKESLSEESELLQKETELRQKDAHIRHRTKVYDEIAVKVLPQSTKIQELTAMVGKTPELFDQNMKQICVYAAYIKRMSNLMLLSQQQLEMSLQELCLALAESLRYLEKCGICVHFDESKKETAIKAKEILNAYEKF